jgi:hypothetical protein
MPITPEKSFASALLLMAAAALSACSSMGETSMTPLINPGKYEYHSCDQIAAAIKGQIGRRDELQGLINRAEQGTGGVVVGALAYRTDYIATGQELKVLEATARDKKCARPADWGSSAVIR